MPSRSYFAATWMWPQITPSTPRSRAWRSSESSKLKMKLTAALTRRLA